MITPELLKDPDYHLVSCLAEKIRQDCNDGTAEEFEDMARSGELALALYFCMKYLVKHDIPVSYDDYKILESWFSHEDEPDWDPDLDDVAMSDEDEVFSQLKVTGIGRVRQ